MVSLYLGVIEIITTLIEHSHYNTVHVSHHTGLGAIITGAITQTCQEIVLVQ